MCMERLLNFLESFARYVAGALYIIAGRMAGRARNDMTGGELADRFEADERGYAATERCNSAFLAV